MEQGTMIEPTSLLDEVFQLLQRADYSALEKVLIDQHPADLARLLESLPHEPRSTVWNLIHEEFSADILSEVGQEVRETLIREMDAEELVDAAHAMDSDDLANVVTDLPDHLGEALKNALSEEVRDRLETSLTFDEETAGRLMTQDAVTARADVTVGVVTRYLRIRGALPANTDSLMVVDRNGTYQGKVSLEALLTNPGETLLIELVTGQNDALNGNATEDEVAVFFEGYDLVSCAVLDDDNKLLGRITIDDVVDIIDSRSSEAMMQMAGLEEDTDLFAPPLKSAKGRTIWLGINLMTAFLAAWVIGLFEGALSQMVALAVLMPIVASMGGIAGSQTLTLTIRGLALNQIGPSNKGWLARKEIVIGLINGIVWAAVVATLAMLWFKNTGISLVIGAAIVINLLIAAVSGVVIPLFLKKMGIDPALSGAVILTTVTDVVGFMSFLGLASLFLL